MRVAPLPAALLALYIQSCVGHPLLEGNGSIIDKVARTVFLVASYHRHVDTAAVLQLISTALVTLAGIAMGM